jgi:hypothetical protein
MDAVDDGRNGTSLLPGRQDLTPNSDATRLRLDHPTAIRASAQSNRATRDISFPLTRCDVCLGPIDDHFSTRRPISASEALQIK